MDFADQESDEMWSDADRDFLPVLHLVLKFEILVSIVESCLAPPRADDDVALAPRLTPTSAHVVL